MKFGKIEKADSGREAHTLLAKLGFMDLDKKHGRHDLACRYVVERAEKIWALVADEDSRQSYRIVMAKTEFHLVKGQGQYATTVGFLDVLIVLENDRGWRGHLGVEVKISRCSVGECLRQLNLYKTYTDGAPFVLVVDFDLSHAEMSEYKAQDVQVFRLGDDFEAWIKDQPSTPAEVPQL